MYSKAVVLLVLVLGVFLIGCTSSPSQNYAAYNNPQNPQQQGQYVGGGCGVASNADNADNSAILDSEDSAL